MGGGLGRGWVAIEWGRDVSEQGGKGLRYLGVLTPSAGSVPKLVAQKSDSVQIRSKCTEIERVPQE
jgi:hypothetical protein